MAEENEGRFELLCIKIENKVHGMGDELDSDKVKDLSEALAHLVVDEVLTLVEYQEKCRAADVAALHLDIDERDIELEQAKSDIAELEHDNRMLSLEIDKRR